MDHKHVSKEKGYKVDFLFVCLLQDSSNDRFALLLPTPDVTGIFALWPFGPYKILFSDGEKSLLDVLVIKLEQSTPECHAGNKQQSFCG